MDMSFLNAVAALHAAKDNNYIDLPQEDVDFLGQNNLWMRGERTRAERSLAQVLYGALDVMGLPRFDLPAEFVAASIAKFVHPVNWQAAADFLSGGQFGAQLARNMNETPVTTRQLFTLVVWCANNPTIAASRTEAVKSALPSLDQE